jgi:hypothetical protein
MNHLYYKIKFAILRSKIQGNPYIGQVQPDGNYIYKKGNCSITYRVTKLPEGNFCIDWIDHKCHVGAYERTSRKIKNIFLSFWYYQKWTVLFKPSILFVLLITVFLFYSEIIESQEVKMARIRWMIASVMAIDPKDIQYIGSGWLEISGERRRIEEKINEPAKYVYEPIKYAFNPLGWMFSSDAGLVRRWRSEGGKGGYASHPVVYNDQGDVWFKKSNGWEHGKLSGEDIKWDAAQVAGLSIRKTPGHEVTVEDRKFRIIDK